MTDSLTKITFLMNFRAVLIIVAIMVVSLIFSCCRWLCWGDRDVSNCYDVEENKLGHIGDAADIFVNLIIFKGSNVDGNREDYVKNASNTFVIGVVSFGCD